MNDRQFINNLIKAYFSDAKEPHQAALNNAVVNRLNDIADKLEKQEQVLKIIDKKNVDIGWLKLKHSVEEYNRWTYAGELTQEEYDLLKRYFK